MYKTEHFSISHDGPCYFIADIAANHDGNLGRALHLIKLAAEAGANAAKFQHFQAEKIVSAQGFESMKGAASHQAKWAKPVVEVYRAATVPDDWTPALRAECDRYGIDFFSSPYHFEAVDSLDPFVSVYKIGSGDITWTDMLRKIASMGKIVMLATGASDIGDVQRAVHTLLGINSKLVLMQCNTNYTGSLENFRHINLNVLKTYRMMFPQLILGLSDHTPGHATVLGSVALGARVVEKHFTDDVTREGPDHPFSMSPSDWRDMVDRTRELENALGSGDKTVAENERETVVIQRRCVRLKHDLVAGTVLREADLDVLRPAPVEAIPPFEISRVIGMELCVGATRGQALTWGMLRQAVTP